MGKRRRQLRFVGISVIETSYLQHQRLPCHAHKNTNIVIVTEGLFIERTFDKKFFCEKGDLLVHPKDQEHSEDIKENSAVLNIELTDEWLEKTWDGSLCLNVPILADQGQMTKKIFDLCRAAECLDSREISHFENVVIEIIDILIRQQMALGEEVSRPKWVCRAKDFIHENSAKACSLKEIAEMVDLHPAYLSRAFKKYTGFHVGEYRRKVRVERAIKKLIHDDLPAAEVAAESGFYDQAHLIRAFREFFGDTPGSLRESIVNAAAG